MNYGVINAMYIFSFTDICYRHTDVIDSCSCKMGIETYFVAVKEYNWSTGCHEMIISGLFLGVLNLVRA